MADATTQAKTWLQTIYELANKLNFWKKADQQLDIDLKFGTTKFRVQVVVGDTPLPDDVVKTAMDNILAYTKGSKNQSIVSIPPA